MSGQPPDLAPDEPSPGLAPDEPSPDLAPDGPSPDLTLRALVEGDRLGSARPGGGDTRRLLHTLADLGAEDLSLARLAEAHLDATSILAEAHIEPRRDVLYGVWAAEEPGRRLTLRERDGELVLEGTKAFATGAGLVDRALVTAHLGDDVFLIDMDASAGLHVDLSEWRTAAFASTATATVTLAEPHTIDVHQVVGGANWYLDRPGFWLGALGPAACWAGGAIGLAQAATRWLTGRPGGDLADRALGELAALEFTLTAVLDAAADAADVDGSSEPRRRALALQTRHVVERHAVAVIDAHDRALGPRPLIRDAWARRHVEELRLYIRQSHAERDLVSLGDAVRALPAPAPGAFPDRHAG